MLLSFPFLCAFLLLFFPAVLLSLFCLNVLQVSIGTSPRNCRAPICAYVYSTHRYVRVCISCAETQAWFISRSWTSWYNSQKLQLQMQLPAASCCWASWQEWFCRTLPLSRLVRHWFIRLRALCDCRSLCCLGTFRSSMFVFLCLFPLRTIQLLRAPCCASQSQVLQSCQEWIAPFAKKKKQVHEARYFATSARSHTGPDSRTALFPDITWEFGMGQISFQVAKVRRRKEECTYMTTQTRSSKSCEHELVWATTRNAFTLWANKFSKIASYHRNILSQRPTSKFQ